MTRVLIIGRSGQLARALAAARWPAGWTFAFAGRETLDLTQHDQIAAVLSAEAPDVVINTAAYTAVDAAETDEAAAFALNAEAPGALAQACRQGGRLLVHLSTDYVFSGDGGAPYDETAPVAPLNAYGRSKAAGEARVLMTDPDALVVRTAWLLSPTSGFVRSILARLTAGEAVRVVGDQRGSPTRADDLAQALIDLARMRLSGTGNGGLLHVAGEDTATWMDLALGLALAVPGSSHRVEAIDSKTYSAKAKRPENAALNVMRLRSLYGIVCPSWTGWITETAKLGLISAQKGVETRQQSGG